MTRVALVSVALLAVAANAVSFHRYHQRQTNPFQGIPDLRTLGFCVDPCAAVAEVQVKQATGDLSSVCTATFASQVGICMKCIGTSPLALLLTNDTKQKIQDAKSSYESQCTAAGSPVTVDIGSAFSVGTNTTSVSTTSASNATTPTTTLSSTGSPSPGVSTTGAGYTNAPSLGMAAAAVIGVFAAI